MKSLQVVIWLLISVSALAEQGVLVVSVRSPSQEVLANVRIGTVGDGSTEFTDSTGRARIRLAPQTRVGGRVQLQLIPPPDLAMVSPWGGETVVPSFDNDSGNLVNVIAMNRRDVNALQNATVLVAIIQASQQKPQRPAPPVPKGQEKPRSLRFTPATTAANLLPPLPPDRGLAFSGLVRVAALPADATPARVDQGLVTENGAQSVGLTKADVEKALQSWDADALTWKIVVLTGMVDTGGHDPFSNLIGNIDGYGITFGIGYWNVRAGTLQGLLRTFRERDRESFDSIMGTDLDFVLRWISAPPREGIQIAVSTILKEDQGRPSARVPEPWNSRFAQLGGHPPFQHIQMERMQSVVSRARSMLARSGLRSERALAFIFDLLYQQGASSVRVQELPADRAAFARVVGREPDEQETLLILANRSAASARVMESSLRSVRQRRLAFALGEGTVYGRQIVLDAAGLGMRDLDTGASIAMNNDAVVLKRLIGGWIPAAEK